MTSEDGQAPELAGSQSPNENQKDEDFGNKGMKAMKARAPKPRQLPMIRPRSTEGMSFGDSAYQTSSTDRPAAPEDTWTPDEAQRILNETKYETARDTVNPR